MEITKSPKRWAAAAMILTSTAFMLAAYATFDRVPSLFYAVYFAALATSAVLVLADRKKTDVGMSRLQEPSR